ncbi:GDSL-type esterase/lipase family protein [Blastococcus mobilis]|nr:GDSL-type esterase/lipase family protein [Blastococcus mobilis]
MRLAVTLTVGLLLAGLLVNSGVASAAPPPNSPYQMRTLEPPVADSYATEASLSADGRLAALAYTYAGGHLVETQTGEQTPVRHSDSPDKPTSSVHVSANGRFIAFFGFVSNADGADTPAVFQREISTGVTRQVYLHSPGEFDTGAISPVAQSSDGRHVFYATSVRVDGGAHWYYWRRDMTTGATEMVTLDEGSQPIAAGVRSLNKAVSSNGRYVVFEGYSGGVGTSYVRDLTTGVSIVIPGLDDAREDRIDVTNAGDVYYSGASGSGRFSASTQTTTPRTLPDGTFIATISPNGRFAIGTTGSRCADGVSSTVTWTVVDISTGDRAGLDTETCQITERDQQLLVTDSGAVLRSRGQTNSRPRLTFVYLRDGGTLPPRTDPDPYVYIALGDSFSAGEGVKPFWQPANACHRSQQAYPTFIEQPGVPDASIYDRRAGGPVAWGFQACSGARTWHVLPRDMGGRPNHADSLPQLEPDRSVDTGNEFDLPVNEATDLITITIGGNNVDFASVLRLCYTSRDCTRAILDGQSIEVEITERLNALGTELDRVYAQIHAQARNARIIVAGYPQLFPASAREQRCPKLRQVPVHLTRGRFAYFGFSETEQNFIRRQTSRLNQVIADHVNQADTAEFVPVDAIFAGHEICGNKGEWINAPQAAARRPSPVNDQSFHPNERGHELGYAVAINAVLN